MMNCISTHVNKILNGINTCQPHWYYLSNFGEEGTFLLGWTEINSILSPNQTLELLNNVTTNSQTLYCSHKVQLIKGIISQSLQFS